MEDVRQNIHLDPRFEHLWKSFRRYVDGVNATRAEEDRLAFANRKIELDFLASLNTPEGSAAYQFAKQEDARLRQVSKERAAFDAGMIKHLFTSAAFLNLALTFDPTARPPGSTNPVARFDNTAGESGFRDFDFEGENSHVDPYLLANSRLEDTAMAGRSSVQSGMQLLKVFCNPNTDSDAGVNNPGYAGYGSLPGYFDYTNSPPDLNVSSDFNNGGRSYAPSSFKIGNRSASGSIGEGDSKPAADPLAFVQTRTRGGKPSAALENFPRRIPLRNVPAHIVIARYPAPPPKRSGVQTSVPNDAKYYVLQCPICSRHFASTQGIYTHIAQNNDKKHLGLYTNGRSYEQTVLICGTLVTDCTAAEAEAHSQAAMNRMMGS